jgi:hypothetical protein
MKNADFSTLKMEEIRSFETSVHTRTARRHIPENSILQGNKPSGSIKCWEVPQEGLSSMSDE